MKNKPENNDFFLLSKKEKKDDSEEIKKENQDEDEVKILIVDDLKLTHSLVRLALENEKTVYHIYSAFNGQEGIDLSLSEKPDIILMDVVMPLVNGFESCRIIKSQKELNYVPIVMITTLDDVKSRIRALEAGADDFLTKPFNTYELIARIKSLIRIKRYHEKIIKQNISYEKELQVARYVQEAILPASSYNNKNFTFEFKSIPCLQVGGDFFNFYEHNEDQFAFFMADVVGHGLAPAFITMTLKIFFDRYAPSFMDTSEFVSQINNDIYKIFGKLYIYITAIYMVLNLKTKSLEIVNAGHTPLIIFNLKKKIIKKVHSNNKMVGIFSDYVYQKSSIFLEEEDFIFMYTDGIFDIVNKEGKILGLKDLQYFIENLKDTQVKNFIPNLEKYLYEYGQGIPFNDDINMLVIQVM